MDEVDVDVGADISDFTVGVFLLGVGCVVITIEAIGSVDDTLVPDALLLLVVYSLSDGFSVLLVPTIVAAEFLRTKRSAML